MSMTLEQVIADCKEEISDCRIDLNGITELLEEYPERKEAFAHEIDNYKKRMDYNRQLAAWLRELQERRKEQYLTIEQIAVAVGTHTIHSAYLWSEFARTLEILGYAVVKRRTDADD